MSGEPQTPNEPGESQDQAKLLDEVVQTNIRDFRSRLARAFTRQPKIRVLISKSKKTDEDAPEEFFYPNEEEAVWHHMVTRHSDTEIKLLSEYAMEDERLGVDTLWFRFGPEHPEIDFTKNIDGFVIDSGNNDQVAVDSAEAYVTRLEQQYGSKKPESAQKV